MPRFFVLTVVYVIYVTVYMEARVRSKLLGLLDETDFEVTASAVHNTEAFTTTMNTAASAEVVAEHAEEAESQPPSSQLDAWQHMLAKMDGKGPPLKKSCVKKKAAVAEAAQQPSSSSATSTCERFSEAWLDAYFDPMVHGYWRVRGGALVYRMPNGQQVAATGVDAFGPFPEMPRYVQKERNASFWDKFKKPKK